MSQGGCQQPGSGFEEHRRPSRPAPPLPTPRLPERCPGGEGTSYPQAGREPPEAGTRAADTPPTPARARVRARRRRSHPVWFPRHPRRPPAHPPDGGDRRPLPRTPPPRRPPAKLPVSSSLPGRAPLPGEGRLRALPEPGSRRSPSPAHSHYSCKVNPRRVTAARLRMCAFLGQAPQSPPSSAPSSRRRGPGERRRRDVARVLQNVNSPSAEGRPQPGPRRPPGPLHFYRRRKRARPGRRVPASRARAPGRLPAAALLRPRRSSAPRLPTGDLVLHPARPAVRLARRRWRPGAGHSGSPRGAARKWPPGRAPRRRRPPPARPPARQPPTLPPGPGPGPELGRVRRSPARAPCPARPSRAARLAASAPAAPGAGSPSSPSRPCPPPWESSPGGDVAAVLVARVHPPGCVRTAVRAWASFLSSAKRKGRGDEGHGAEEG